MSPRGELSRSSPLSGDVQVPWRRIPFARGRPDLGDRAPIEVRDT